MNYSFILTLLIFCTYLGEVRAAEYVRMTVEQKLAPLGVDVVQPRFGWQVRSAAQGAAQGAYQIQVSTDSLDLLNGRDLFWDSRKQQSSRQQFIPLTVSGLRSATKYFWRVRVWDDKKQDYGWSPVAAFVTGLLKASDWEDVKWIAHELLDPAMRVVPGVHLNGDDLGGKALKRAVIPLFRKEFELKKPVKEAFLYISGLGHYEAYLNGDKLGEDFLAPGWTNYAERCLYNTHDVTAQLKQGANALGAWVGTGFRYINRERYRKLVRAEDYPMLRAKLIIHYEDGTTDMVLSDASWKSSPSPIQFSTIYGGEDYDARLEQSGWNRSGFRDADWKAVEISNGPKGSMRSESDYPLRVMERFEAVHQKKISAHSMLYDFGQNASGIVELTVKGQAGDRIRITPAEVLDDEGMPYQKASGDPYYFEYIVKGGATEQWRPRFSYYGFRYALVEVEKAGSGKKPELSIALLHTRNSAPKTGEFESSSPLFNEIYSLIDWGIKSNLASVATDCPHREKLGWLEQTHLIGSSLQYNYAIYPLYSKIIDDMMESQLPNGLVPDIVPEYVPFDGGFRDSPEWGSASIIIPWYLYQWYGDSTLLHKAYPMMVRYFDYLSSKSEGHILSHGLGDWFDLGPKNPGVSQLTPIALTATATYYYDASLLANISRALGKSAEATKYEGLASKIRAAFNGKFYDPETGLYATGSQTAYAMPLYMGIVPEEDRRRVEQNLQESIRKGNLALTAGDVGYRYLLRALEASGASQLIFEMNNRDDVPGYGYQLKHGATALTESWPALKFVSNNHMMLGHLMEWLFSGLAGIRQQDDNFGYDKLRIQPAFVDGMDWVKASYESLNGPVKVHWGHQGGKREVNLEIPFNSTAELVLPEGAQQSLVLNGEAVKSGSSTINLTSGNYKLIF